MATTSIRYTIYAGNLGDPDDVTRAQADAYADAVEAALLAAFPEAAVDVTLEHAMTGSAPRPAVDTDEDEDSMIDSVRHIAQEVYDAGDWLN